MLCIVRLHQGKAVRKHGRPWQTPICSRCCDLVSRPFVWVSTNKHGRVTGCRTRFMALEVEPINFHFFFASLLPGGGGAVLSVSARTWPTRTDGRMRGHGMHAE